MFQIYTLPNCAHCHEAIELMKQKGIQLESINTSILEGRNKFRKLYMQYKTEIRREQNGMVILPVIVYNNNNEIRIHQGTEGLEKFLSG